ncbi:MAG TPA: TonB-dependent receptor [Gemmatimonadaceae bacterium]|nr:TonB-dependent receptor [Gemmatimonadaceae bacterium]
MHKGLAFVVLVALPLGAQVDSTRRDTAYLAPTVVTVVRTTMDVARAPYAVGVTTRDEIQRGRPGLALDEALAGIPGVQVDNRFNYALGERISIRGFGARAQFGVRGVRVLLDGVPMTLADGQTSLNNVDVASVARAEVVRGPASAMHGNAAGGVIQLASDDPVDMREGGRGSLSTDYGEHAMLRTHLGIGAHSGRVDYALTASRLRYDGYRRWNEAQNDRLSVRATADFAGDKRLGVNFNWVDYDAQNPGGLSAALLAADRRQAFTNNVRFQTGEEGKQGQLGATWDQDLAGARLNVSAHGLQRRIENPIPQRIVAIDRHAGGARVALSGAPVVASRALRLSAGGEWQLQRDDRRNFISNDGVRGADTLNQLEHVNNVAAFTQAVVDLHPRLVFMAGARYDHIRFEADDRLIGTAGGGNPDDSGERTMRAVSPSVGLSFRALSLLDVYSNFSTSFETPTTSELSNQESGAGGFNPTLEPQRTRSVEGGVNGRILGVGLAGTYQISVYNARVTDALIPFELASLPGRQYFRNAGSTTHRGVETAVSLALPRDFALRASFTHTDARFDDYAVTSAGATTVYDGNRVPGVAPNRADATMSYLPRRFFVDWDTRASSAIPVNDANSDRSPSYVIHGLRLGARDIALGTIGVTPHAGVMNLFDREYNTSVVVNAFGGRFYEPGPPRSFYGGIALKF